MIAGELRRYLRDFRSLRVSRSLRDIACRAVQAREELSAAGIAEPTPEDIAAHIGADRREVAAALEAMTDPVSIYEPVYSDAGDTLCVLDQLGDGSDTCDWLDEIVIKDAIGGLRQREKNILYLRFFQGRTQTEVARSIGISQAQVSRLEKAALDRIKGML